MNGKLGNVTRTCRGFELLEFKDRYGVACSLQASNLAVLAKPGTSAVWLGVEDANPQVLATEAHLAGIHTNETCGWIPFKLPDAVRCTTRMHLDRGQVEALIAHLQRWLEKDTFELPPALPTPARARLVHEAREFALAAHGDQQYEGRPYIFHLDAVVGLLEGYGGLVRAVGYLHDVLEDTEVSAFAIEQKFGTLVRDAVELCTDPEAPTRAARKELANRKFSASSNLLGLLAKTADRLANLIHAQQNNSRIFAKYKAEHDAFRSAVYRKGMCDALWARIDAIVG